ncbi:WDR20 family WD repeat protein [Schizosaccharomyces japonicus yFS275]|uniref:WDR20 family WD repeat protein n=1 Tax=Schizosaccharomyces japonicus (strain yFS275 / FY16936) TaxID=402676 RepID=B6JZ73_SCHJY|nr:WDR20 family WD repeat protein [Schizosaccharomyces japonicus yFS275]EEB06841.1 WDR20 family WD repeat protein [Schizosaccharomyces japonicus yFS275]
MASGIAQPVLFLSSREGEYVLRDELVLRAPQQHHLVAHPLDPNGHTFFTWPIELVVVRMNYDELVMNPDFVANIKKNNGVFTADDSHEYPSVLLDLTRSHKRSYSTSSSHHLKLHRSTHRSSANRSSTFVRSMCFSDHFLKLLSSKTNCNVFGFAIFENSFYWVDLSKATTNDFLCQITFAQSRPTSLDLNMLSKSSFRLDLVVGLDSGDIVWYNPLNLQYIRLNKGGCFNDSPIVTVKWVPGYETLFLAVHKNGWLSIYDTQRSDQPVHLVVNDRVRRKISSGLSRSLLVIKSTHSTDDKKFNPVSCYAIPDVKITAASFSPECQHIAVVTSDGKLIIVDYLRERISDIFSSYYGGFSCVAWSPDGKFLITGGEDDLISVWSFPARKLFARGQGHKSFVKAVVFDEWRCDGDSYRFASVGMDCQLLLWDFSVGAIHRPKSSMTRRSLNLNTRASSLSMLNELTPMITNSSEDQGLGFGSSEEEIVHELPPCSTVPLVTPVAAHKVDNAPVTSICFQPDCMIIAGIGGRIRVWQRP